MIGGYFAPTFALWRRDITRTMRKRRTAVFLGLYVGILAILIISFWPSRNMTPFMVQNYAEDTLGFFAILSYIWIVIVMPPYGAASLTQEHERETMEMLSLTLVPSWGVVVGKIGAHTGLFLLVLLAALPVMAASAFFTVGTEIPTVLALAGLIAGTSIACVTIGIACSSIAKSSKSAVIFGYIGTAFMLGLPVLMFGVVFGVLLEWDTILGYQIEPIFERMIRYFTPLGATAMLLNESFNWPDYIAIQLYLGVNVAVSMLFACWRFARMNRQGLIARHIEKSAARRTKKGKRRVRPFRPIGDHANAWYVREMQFGTLTRGRVKWIMFAAGTVVFGLIASGFTTVHWRDGGDGGEFVQSWVGLCVLALVVVMPGVAANAYTREFDGTRMDLLRGTLISTPQFVLGTIFSSLRSVVPLLLAIVLTTLALSPIISGNRDCYQSLGTGSVTGVVTLLLATAIGVAVGTYVRRTTTALMLAYASVFVMFFAGWVLIFFAGEFLAELAVRAGTHTRNNAPKLMPLRDFAQVSSPLVAYFVNIDEAKRNDLYTPYWFQSIVLGLGYTAVFTLAAITGFRWRVVRDA